MIRVVEVVCQIMISPPRGLDVCRTTGCEITMQIRSLNVKGALMWQAGMAHGLVQGTL